PLQKLPCNRSRLFDEDTHWQAPDEASRPQRVLPHKPVPRPHSQNALCLTEPGGNSDEAIAAFRARPKGALPWMRVTMSGYSTKPMLEVHWLILSPRP